MCAFLLLAGTRRYVPTEARVLVHQIWLGAKSKRAREVNYTADELQLVQRDIGRLARYTAEMGGSMELIETALRVPPWEPMYRLTADELRRMRVTTVDHLFEPDTPAPAVAAAAPSAITTSAQGQRPTRLDRALDATAVGPPQSACIRKRGHRQRRVAIAYPGDRTMAKFIIQPHGRLQEWIAHEKGYFRDEGLDYEFAFGPSTGKPKQLDGAGKVPDMLSGAFESYKSAGGNKGAKSDISCACHWTVNQAASQRIGTMWGKSYVVAPGGIMVPPDSPITKPEDLAGQEIAVGYHSGSHFTTIQSLEPFLPREQINLKFVGSVWARVDVGVDRDVPATSAWGLTYLVLEQLGFRKVVDTSFMIGFMFPPGVDPADVEKYMNGMKRAQMDLDFAAGEIQAPLSQGDSGTVQGQARRAPARARRAHRVPALHRGGLCQDASLAAGARPVRRAAAGATTPDRSRHSVRSRVGATRARRFVGPAPAPVAPRQEPARAGGLRPRHEIEPRVPHGWQRHSRASVIQPPAHRPKRPIASSEYSEQVGRCRQSYPISGESV